ncbi:MAG: DUF4062 domain-containing protein [Methanophagales archaeon]|nr:DUF4062 domain-containing protein [Methanophagales archaeon]
MDQMKYRVFISSVIEELKEERDAAKEAIEELSRSPYNLPFEPVMFKLFGARTSSPREVYKEEVRRSNVYLGIIGKKYGTIIEESGLSATHEEYRTAYEAHKEILIYVLDIDESRDVREAKEWDFIKELGRHTYKKFKNEDQLKDYIKNDLIAKYRGLKKNRLSELVKTYIVPLCLGVIFVIFTIIYILFIPSITSNVSVDDYAFPPWINSEELQDPAKDKSIKWEYKIDCKCNRLCFATVNLELEKEQDLSSYTGISFSAKANKSINETNSEDTPTLEFLVHTNKDRGYMYWTGKNNKNMSISEEWMNKTTLFSDLKIAHWTNDSEAPSEPNLKKVYALNFAAPTSTQRSNNIWIHDIKLIHKDGNETSIVTGKVPILSPEDPLHGKWITPLQIFNFKPGIYTGV